MNSGFTSVFGLHSHFKHVVFFYLQLEGEVSDLKTQSDTELAARDAKLEKLKMQLADLLTDNSR